MQIKTTLRHYFASTIIAGKQSQNKFCQRDREIGVQILPVECEAVQMLWKQQEVYQN